MSKPICPLISYTCDTCAYNRNCAPSRAEKNTEEIIALLGQVLNELRNR